MSLSNAKPEKFFTLNFLNDIKFDDMFEKRGRIIIFLEEQFSDQKEKVI